MWLKDGDKCNGKTQGEINWSNRKNIQDINLQKRKIAIECT